MKTLHPLALTTVSLSMLLLTACGNAGGNGAVSPSESPTETEGPGSTASADPTETPDELTNQDIEGKWGSDEAGDPFLEFRADGDVVGTDGCNGIATTYRIDGTTVTLEPWASTMRACPGVDGWLQHTRTVEVTHSNENADEMTVKDKDGKEIGTLIREK